MSDFMRVAKLEYKALFVCFCFVVSMKVFDCVFFSGVQYTHFLIPTDVYRSSVVEVYDLSIM